MPILEILLAVGLAVGLGAGGRHAFNEWQFQRRVSLCSNWIPENDDFGCGCDLFMQETGAPSNAKGSLPRRERLHCHGNARRTPDGSGETLMVNR